MDASPEAHQLQLILTNLGREICLPLDLLHEGISRFLDDGAAVPEAERAQARTMLAISEELGRLTRERLGPAGASGPSTGAA